MTSSTETLKTAAGPLWRTIVAVVGFGFVRIRNVVLAFRHRRDVEMLARFDDRMLADIGLTRNDLHSALAEPFWRDPGHVLIARAGESRRARRLRPGRPTGATVTAPSIVPDPAIPARATIRC